MGKKIKVALSGKVDDPLDQLSLRSLTVNVKLADATKIAAFVLGLDQIVDRGVGRPILYVVARAIGADERHHPKSGSFGVDELMRTLVRSAIRQDRVMTADPDMASPSTHPADQRRSDSTG